MIELLDVNIPEPNEALTALLLSPRMRATVEGTAELAKSLYQAQVAKRTGALAASANAHAVIGGKHHDRWVGELVIGEGIEYGASHEFGTGFHARSRHNLDRLSDQIQHGAHDLNRVLEELGGL